MTHISFFQLDSVKIEPFHEYKTTAFILLGIDFDIFLVYPSQWHFVPLKPLQNNVEKIFFLVYWLNILPSPF